MYWLSIVSCLAILLSGCAIAQDTAAEISPFSVLVYRRYYVATRITKTLSLLKLCMPLDTVSCNTLKKHAVAISVFFTHVRVLQCLKIMEHTGQLDSLVRLSQEIIDYRYIKDDLCVVEFIRLLTLTVQGLLGNMHDTLKLLQGHQVLRLDIGPEEIAHHFYFVHRLRHLYSYHDLLTASLSVDSIDYRMVDAIKFKHKRILYTIRQMRYMGSFAPLTSLWRDLNEYKYIKDDLFVSEITKLLCVVYKGCITSWGMSKAKAHSFSGDISAMYQDLAILSLEQTFELLDLIVDQVPHFLEKIEFYSKMSWKAWIKKYWWTAAILASFVVYRMRHIFMSPHGDPDLHPQGGHDASCVPPFPAAPAPSMGWFDPIESSQIPAPPHGRMARRATIHHGYLDAQNDNVSGVRHQSAVVPNTRWGTAYSSVRRLSRVPEYLPERDRDPLPSHDELWNGEVSIRDCVSNASTQGSVPVPLRLMPDNRSEDSGFESAQEE